MLTRASGTEQATRTCVGSVLCGSARPCTPGGLVTAPDAGERHLGSWAPAPARAPSLLATSDQAGMCGSVSTIWCRWQGTSYLCGAGVANTCGGVYMPVVAFVPTQYICVSAGEAVYTRVMVCMCVMMCTA